MECKYIGKYKIYVWVEDMQRLNVSCDKNCPRYYRCKERDKE
jgi:hypothetical protein